MAKPTLQDQIAAMETRCRKLEKLQKLFEKAIKNEFGIEAPKIHRLIITNTQPSISNFDQKIRSFYHLNSNDDLADFIRIFCSKSCLDYYQKTRCNIKQE